MLAVLILPAQAMAGSKILVTGGASPIEGGGGGGLSPWAVITGYGSSDEWGGSAFATNVNVDDYELNAFGVAGSYSDRIELSYARQKLEIAPLNLNLRQDIFGAKLRVAGALLYSRIPQISLGVQHKRNRDFAVPQALGAENKNGTDFYLSAGKMFFAAVAGRNLYLNSTLRYTDANETGLLGFGGPKGGRSFVLEGSAVLFLKDRWVLGYDYRQKPDHLDSVRESDWQDIFVGYFPSKRFSVVAAYADLDEIAGLPDQTGTYVSLQFAL